MQITIANATVARDAIRSHVEDYGRDKAENDICAYYNCNEASVDLSGDVWIAEPCTGHWLPERDLIRVAEHIVNVL